MVIDDARLLLSPPPPPHDPGEWPDLNEVTAALSAAERRARADGGRRRDRLLPLADPRGASCPRAPARARPARRVGPGAGGEPTAAQLEQRVGAGTDQLARSRRSSRASPGRSTTCGSRSGRQARACPARQPNLAQRVGWLERRYARRLFGVPMLMQELKDRANRLATLRHHPPKPLSVPASYSANGRIPDAPTISIVTPSLNHAEFLPATIESVLEQDYPALEYVVQDGGSDDGTREILERYADRLHHWDSAPDGGQAEALNLGFATDLGRGDGVSELRRHAAAGHAPLRRPLLPLAPRGGRRLRPSRAGRRGRPGDRALGPATARRPRALVGGLHPPGDAVLAPVRLGAGGRLDRRELPFRDGLGHPRSPARVRRADGAPPPLPRRLPGPRRPEDDRAGADAWAWRRWTAYAAGCTGAT